MGIRKYDRIELMNARDTWIEPAIEALSENKRNYPACRVKELFCDPYRQRAGVPDYSSL